jgi:glycerophosphoryl diester phosphodiesterase
MTLLHDLPQPVLFAHRGASAHAPENTLEAFRLAFKQGAEAIELDVKLSADGQVIVIHDSTLDRTTNGEGRVASFDLSDLRALDAGVRFSEAFRGARIPTLEEVFEILGKTGFVNIELTNYFTPNDALVEKVCELVRRHNLQNQVLFSSFFISNLKKAARLIPEVPRGLLAMAGWMGVWARSFGFMFGDYQALHTHKTNASPQQVLRAHRLRRRIHVWTANTAEEVLRFKEWGVDGIITADPQMAVRVLGRGS